MNILQKAWIWIKCASRIRTPPEDHANAVTLCRLYHTLLYSRDPERKVQAKHNIKEFVETWNATDAKKQGILCRVHTHRDIETNITRICNEYWFIIPMAGRHLIINRDTWKYYLNTKKNYPENSRARIIYPPIYQVKGANLKGFRLKMLDKGLITPLKESGDD